MARRKKKSAEYTKQDNGSIGLSKAALEALDTGTYGKMTNRTPTATRSEDQIKVVQRVPALRGMKTVTPKQNTERRTERKTMSYSPSYKTEKKEKRGTSYTPMYNNMVFTGKKNEKVDNKVVNDVADKKNKLDVSIDNDLKQYPEKQKQADKALTSTEKVTKSVPQLKGKHTGSGRSFMSEKQKALDDSFANFYEWRYNRLGEQPDIDESSQTMVEHWKKVKQDMMKENGWTESEFDSRFAEYEKARRGREAEESVAAAKELGQKNPIGATLLQYAYMPQNWIEGGATAAEGLGAKLGKLTGVNPLEKYTPTSADDTLFTAARIRSAMKEGAKENIPESGRFVYDILTSVPDMAGGPVGMAAQSAENKQMQALANGVEANRAAETGLASGALSAITNAIGMESALGAEAATPLKAIAKAAGAESLENLIEDLGTNAVDIVFNKDKSELGAQYNAYRNQGYSAKEAVTRMAKDVSVQELMSVLTGAVMGGTLRGINAIPELINNGIATPLNAIDPTFQRFLESTESPEELQQELGKLETNPETPINRASAESEVPEELQRVLEKQTDSDLIEDVEPEIITRQYSDAERAEIEEYAKAREAIRAENAKNVNPTDLVAMTKFNELRAQGKAMDAEMQQKYPELFDYKGKFTGIPEITEGVVNPETPAVGNASQNKGIDFSKDYNSIQNKISNGQKPTDTVEVELLNNNDVASTHTPEQLQIMRDYLDSTDSNLTEFVQSVRDSNYSDPNTSYTIKATDKKTADAINEVLGKQTEGYDLDLQGKGLEHLDLDHGINGSADHSMADPETIARIKYVLDNFDGYEKGNGTGMYKQPSASDKTVTENADTILFYKKVNGNYYVVEAVPDAKAKKNYIVSAYTDSSKINGSPQMPNVQALGGTSETIPRSSDLNIPLDTENVNSGKITEPDVNSPHTKTSEAYTNTGRRGGGWIGDEYKKYTDPKQFQYEDSNEKETVNNAIKMRETEGREGFKNRVMEQERLTASEVDGLMMEWRNLTSEARDLDKIGAKSQDKWDEAVRVFRKVQEQASSNAQALQALAKWSRNTPEGLLAQAENILNGRVKVDKSAPQKLIEKFTKSGKKFQFEDHFVKEFLQEAQDIPRLDPDSREANIKMSKLGELINDQMPSTLGEKVTTWLMDSMLGNFRTLIARNAGGNVGLAAVEQLAQRPLAAGIDMLVSKKTGRRTQAGLSLEGLNDYIHGFAKGIKDEISDIGTGLHTARSGENTLERAIQANRHVFKKGGILDEYDNRIKNGLSFGDRDFYEGVYAQTLGDYNRLRAKGVMGEAIQNLSDEQFKQYSEAAAKLNALAAVYQNDTKISEAMLEFKNAVGDLSRGAFGVDILSQFSMPFVKTPANVVNVGIDYSPLGAVRNTVKTINEVKNGAFDQNRFVNETARNIIGTGLMGGAYAMAKNGKINGAYSEDTDEKQAQKEAGEQEYALNLPGGYQMDIGWLPVVGSNAVAAAAAQDAASKGKGNAVSNFLKGLAKGGETMFDQSMFQGLQRLMGGDGNYDSDAGLVGNLKNTVEQGIGQAIPSLLRQIGQVEDDYQRDLANSNKGLGFEKAYNFNSLLNSIPTVREIGLAPKVETTGELAKQNQGRGKGMKILEDMILPGKISKVEYSALNEEAQRLKDATDSADAYMPKAARKNFDTEDHILSNKEWTEAQQKYYKGMTDVGTKLMESEEYKSADTDTQLKTMKKAYDGIKQAVQCEYNGKEPTDAVAKAYTNAGGGEKGVQAAFDYCRQSMSGAAVEQQTGLKGNTTANQMIQEDIANGDQTAADEKIRAAEIIGKSFKVPSVTSTYYQVQTKVPEMTPEKYVDVYKKIDVNGSQDVQQGELEKYINMMFGEKDKEKAEAYWEGFYDHKNWKNKAEQEKILVWENGKYVSKYPKK